MYSTIPRHMMRCAECKEQLFYETEEMILHFLNIGLSDTFYNDSWDAYDTIVDCEKKMTHEEWTARNNNHHEYLFGEAFSPQKSEIATINRAICPHCNHENTYESFYINDEFIMNQR